MKANVLNLKNKNVGELELDDSVFARKGAKEAIYEVVKMQFANKRKGCAATRNHTLVSGTTAKMYRQKGTGRARHGDYRTNIFVGGGKAFGPHPRDYSYSVPKKVKKAALASALTQKMKDGRLLIVDDFELSGVKTKAFVETMKTLGVKTGLVVIEKANETLTKSARNVPTVKVLRWEGLNVADLLRFEHVVIAKPAVAKIQEALKL